VAQQELHGSLGNFRIAIGQWWHRVLGNGANKHWTLRETRGFFLDHERPLAAGVFHSGVNQVKDLWLMKFYNNPGDGVRASSPIQRFLNGRLVGPSRAASPQSELEIERRPGIR
jgi:hypothetical protein